jgi:hypothetical protein
MGVRARRSLKWPAVAQSLDSRSGSGVPRCERYSLIPPELRSGKSWGGPGR